MPSFESLLLWGREFKGLGLGVQGVESGLDLGGKKAIYSLESRLLVTSANVSYKN